MPSKERRDHYEEEYNNQWKDYQQVWVETDEGVDREERKSMCRLRPVEKTDQAVLENEDDSYPSPCQYKGKA